MENKSKYSDVIKTDSFFIGKKSDKEIYIQKSKDLEFNKVCKFISKSDRRINRHNTRLEKRQKNKDYCIKFIIKKDQVDFEILGKYIDDEFPKLERLEFILYSEHEGVFRGNQLEFDSFINKLRGA